MNSESLGWLERGVAAAATLEEIERLVPAVPSKVASMLSYIRDHLFEPSLSVASIKEHCGLRDNSIALHFHRAVGLPPAAFVTSCRLNVAEKLLRDTQLPVWKITELLGYSSIQVFSRAYSRCKGIRPSAFRRQKVASLGSTSRSTSRRSQVSTTDLLHQALAGELEGHLAADLIHRLLAIYPPQRRLSSAPLE